MTSAKSSQRGRIIIWRLFGLETGSRSEKLPRHQGGSCGYSHAVQKIAAGDTALHSQLAVVVFAHWAPETSECCDGPLSVGFLYRQFRTLEANLAVRSVAERLIDR